MTTTKQFAAIVLAALLAFGAHDAIAHCDGVDGPVAKAVQKTLETGNVNPVLAFAPASAEAELQAAFAEVRSVRVLGLEARKLADRSFLETAIRLHRAGEGADFTGVKPAGVDYGPMIPAAERAIATGDPKAVKALLLEDIDHALRARLEHIRELSRAPLDPETYDGVAAARERISAELGFVIFAEGLRQAVLGKTAPHHE